jgi:hypothetical protein
MTKYRVTVGVAHAKGWQSIIVEASSKKEAIELVNKGEGEFDCEELEVRSLTPKEDWTVEEDK